MNLTPEELVAVHDGRAIHGVQSGIEFVVTRADLYDHVRRLLSDTDPEEMYPRLAEVSPEDWEEASNYGLFKVSP
jgi:hypothetical protein